MNVTLIIDRNIQFYHILESVADQERIISVIYLR